MRFLNVAKTEGRSYSRLLDGIGVALYHFVGIWASRKSAVLWMNAGVFER